MVFADDQRGLVTPEQAVSCGAAPEGLDELVSLSVAEPVFGGAVRLRAGGRHPFPRLLAGWLLLEPATAASDRTVPASGVVSHRSAVRFYRIGDYAPPVPRFTASPTAPVNDQSAVLYRAELTPSDWRTVDDLPVTTPARTIGDLAAAERALPDRWRDLVATLATEPKAGG